MALPLFFSIEEQSSIKCAVCKDVKHERATYLCYMELTEEGAVKTRRLCPTCGSLQLKRDIRQSQKLLKKLKRVIDNPKPTT